MVAGFLFSNGRLGQGAGDRDGRRSAVLLQKQADGDGPGNHRQRDEGKSDVAEKANVGGFILRGL